MSQATMFDEAAAAAYDQRFAKLFPFRDALHLVTQFALEPLPDDARLLVVGAGTGAEIVHLASLHPGWRFTAVDPSGPMLAKCREKAEAMGIASRCHFHEGHIDSLTSDAPFHGATALLVSQFVLDEDQRRAFFRAIAERLQPGAPLVSADLASPLPRDPLLALWTRAWRFADMPPEHVERMPEMFDRVVSVPTADGVASLIEAAGFEPPLRCFQALMMHGWLTHRSS